LKQAFFKHQSIQETQDSSEAARPGKVAESAGKEEIGGS